MLRQIRVRDIAILEALDLELGEGLTVITGETGAGKSLLLGAVGLLLGQRAGPERVRGGATRGSVEGLFDLRRHPGAAVLREALGLDPGEEDLAVSRVLDVAGDRRRDTVRIGGLLASVTALRAAARDLVDVASQHEQVHLLDEARHASYLDTFAGAGPLAAEVAAAVRAWRRSVAEREALEAGVARREERQAFLAGALEDVAAGAWARDEETRLRDEVKELAHAVELQEALQGALGCLYEGEGDVVSTLGRLVHDLAAVQRWAPRLEGLVTRIDASRIELEEAAYELRDHAGRCEPDPARLDRLQGRLAAAERLCRRYGVGGLAELLDRAGEWAAERDRLDDLDQGIREARTAEDAARETALDAARRLHARRAEAASRLDGATVGFLSRLAMEKAVFRTEVLFGGVEALVEGGADRVRFTLAANPGEPPRPLAAVASGGELSRVLLALKAALADAYPVPVYVFDEVDAGIGGRTGLEAGRLLAELGRRAQVLCVSHLAQIAAFADRHLVITKSLSGPRAAVSVAEVRGRDRVAELARMQGGEPGSKKALAAARELLEHARTRQP
ncbi:MAG: DNA repair protein RecN [Deltaproteobacteria bacterium]|nr:DNA repair protein RecN [Deltaproteobacteria bacterium]